MVIDDAPHLAIAESRSTAYAAIHALARSFALPVFEPTWWPVDIGELTYEIKELGSGSVYFIGPVRNDGAPIVVLGQAENPRAHLPSDHWQPTLS